MQVTTQNIGPCEQLWTVVIPAETVKKHFGEILRLFSAHAQVDGFRRGHVPPFIVASRFRKEIEEELRDRLGREAMGTAVGQAPRRPLSLLDVRWPASLASDRDVTIAFHVEVRPEFDMPPYKELVLRRPSVSVEDEHVEQAIQRMREDHADYRPVTDRPARAGDFARIDFEAHLDGQPLEQAVPAAAGLGRGQGRWVAVDETADFVPGLTTALLGARIGDEREFDVTFPEDFRVAPLRGRTARYRVRLLELREAILPEITPEWLRRFGVTSVEDLRARIRESLQRTLEEEVDLALRRQAISMLVDRVQMDLPRREFAEAVRYWTTVEVRQLRDRGLGESEIRAQADAIRRRAEDLAQHELRTRFLVERIAELEGIKVTEEEFDQECQRLARRMGQPVEEYRRQADQTELGREIRRHLLQEKVVRWLVEHAKVET